MVETVNTRAGRAALVTAAAALAAYPILRPWSPETGMAGAQTFGSIAWPVSHALGMLGFVSLAFALRALWLRAEVAMWGAVALLLPYYGAEAYGLHAVGQFAIDHGDAEVLAIADQFRYGVLPGATFVLGLLLLAVVGWQTAREVWSHGSQARLGATAVAVALATYFPQFFAPAAVRIGHGVVLAAGLLLLAAAVGDRGQISRRSLAQRVSS